ncbi:MAG: sigma-70 family RNA polymerase sigma factor [Tissierellia bacterium]|nr:sigma-70 family RNA polymerase sigma factor [Tissierellia bacterium]
MEKNDVFILKKVNEAKQSMLKADELIASFLPFIRSETSKFLKRVSTDQDDEVSIAMIAFHEAIKSFNEGKGAFISYASMVIRSRLIDYARKEARHKNNVSFSEPVESGEDISLEDRISDDKDHYEDSINLNQTKKEIFELTEVMQEYGVSLIDATENTPKQERTLEACRSVIQYAIDHIEILQEIERTKKLPIKKLVDNTDISKKTIERHRKYILAMMIIQTNGFEIIRSHMSQVLSLKGGANYEVLGDGNLR